ncbi:hypothetical protein EJ05DRAFT_476326 [Pseudovirgaria hyperparasitica]|uniref:Uncharacterized protein n=1 Tax=Pseudovirgaria hyperparasitica TaxID=470096 RepID=A0A6A6WAA8_9PEZI|nr:uncharacterized protein EJ05DRAFT_476326 [Pseudovirgaria hyperparasitica]KAF2758051.1 hypothetical protein EJ05DRAFT_476326 [Pseudovirgaria hyperparasitica]
MVLSVDDGMWSGDMPRGQQQRSVTMDLKQDAGRSSSPIRGRDSSVSVDKQQSGIRAEDDAPRQDA